jgi:uncharacterized protein (TIRG00374 family)
MRRFKLVIQTVFSLAVSAIAVYFSLRNTKLHEVAAAMAAADPLRIVAYVCVLLCVHLVRTLRWGILLEPLGHVSFKRLNSASAVGFMLLMLLPLRLGEFARPLLIARPLPGGGGPLRRSGAMASIVVERIVDGIFIGLAGMICLRMLGDSASGKNLEFARSAALLVAVGFFSLGVALVLAVLFHDRALALASAIFRPLSPRLAQRVTGILDSFIGAVHLGSGWKVLAFFVLTALYWTMNAFALGLLAPAFGFTGFTPLMLAVILTIQVVGVMVPAGPGMVGTMQFFTQAGLSLFSTDGFSARGAAFANTIWTLQFLQQVLTGVVFLVAGHASLKGVLGTGPVEEEAPAGAAP